eukprot:9493838-Pyramimonas_sp.AAC.1
MQQAHRQGRSGRARRRGADQASQRHWSRALRVARPLRHPVLGQGAWRAYVYASSAARGTSKDAPSWRSSSSTCRRQAAPGSQSTAIGRRSRIVIRPMRVARLSARI